MHHNGYRRIMQDLIKAPLYLCLLPVKVSLNLAYQIRLLALTLDIYRGQEIFHLCNSGLQHNDD